MALQIMKIAVSASGTVDVNPTVARFFYVTTTSTGAGDSLSIDAEDFFDDNGVAVVNLPVLNTDNSSYNVYINGVLQMEGISSYTPGGAGVGSLEITVPTLGAPINSGVPIVVEVVNYTPTSTITVTT